jgi:hypothetical protein
VFQSPLDGLLLQVALPNAEAISQGKKSEERRENFMAILD